MRTINKTVCEFKELPESARDKALQELREIATTYDWWDFVYDDAKAIGKILGIEIKDIWFRGFSSQGDGACFEGQYKYKKGCVKKIKEYAPIDEKLHEIAQTLYEIQRPNFYRLVAEVKHQGRSYHEFCTNITVYNEHFESPYYYSHDYVDNDTHESISEVLRDFMKWIYKQLENEYDSLTSEESLIENAEANDYEFYEDGSIFFQACVNANP